MCSDPLGQLYFEAQGSRGPRPHISTPRRRRRWETVRTLRIQWLAATACASALLISGCSFDPIREVQPAREPGTTPAVLAFDAPAAAPEPASSTPADPTTPPLDVLPAATWVVNTDRLSLNAYSGPDSLYTRVGELAADDAVLATGRRVESRDTVWMEISWDDATAWIDAAALTQSGSDS